MKKLFLLILFLTAFCALAEPQPPLQSSSAISPIFSTSWNLSVYGGIEWMLTKSIGLRTLIGTSLLLPLFIADESFILEGEATMLYRPPRASRGFIWGLSAGASNVGGVWYEDEDSNKRAFEAIMSLGVNGMSGCRLKSGREIRLWLGAGFPFFYENGWETRDIHFPLNLWPNLKVELRL